MKKLICIALILTLALSLFGCSLFSQKDVVQLGDYAHKDPDGLTYDERLVLKNESFGNTLSGRASEAAYPDTIMFDEAGNPVGIYMYDETTGLATGWTSLSTGTFEEFPAGEEVDLGKPDASLLVTFRGEAAMYCVVYGNKGKAVEADLYVLLSDKEDKQAVTDAMADVYGVELKAESDTALKAVVGADAIADEFAAEADMGFPASSEDAKGYAELLSLNYGVREDMGPNPYKPYEGHEDPTDIDYDQKVVLTGSGQAGFLAEDADKISSQTDFLYAKDGKMVAQYTYFECPSKEAADDLFAQFPTAERVSDTVFTVSTVGQELEANLKTYIGFNVIKDDSIQEYTRMIEETFASAVYE